MDFFEQESNYKERIVSEKRLKVFKILVYTLIIILFSRLFWIEIVEGGVWQNIAETNKIRIQEISAPRGLIYSKDGVVLAKNIPMFEIAVVPADLSKDLDGRKELIEEIKEITDNLIELDESALEVIKEAPSTSYEEIVISGPFDYQLFVYFKTKFKNFPGVKIKYSLKREYPQGEIFSHILGYLGRINKEELEVYSGEYNFNDYLGRAGVEKVYESILKGEKGLREIEVNSYGQEEKILSEKPSYPGKDIVLTINAHFQEKLAELLNKYLKKYNLSSGTVIALNPNNGEILAMLSQPTYDNNILILGTNEQKQDILNNKNSPLVFRAISGIYPSGSTIKGALAAGALEEGIIDENFKVNSTGGIKVGKWFFPDWKPGGHGKVNVIQALAHSVNTFFYYIGGGYEDFKGLGVEKINYYLNLFGFGEKTGIDLPNEASGLLPTPEWKQKVKGEIWYPGDTYHLSIGQGDILVTPLQIANYTAVLANKGTLFKPKVVSEFIDPVTKSQEKIEAQVIRDNFISLDSIDIVRQGFRAAVTEGSARQLNDLPFTVAGKTGTAQVSNKNPHAWFTCFAPYENPEIVLTILLENGGEGSSVAVPLAREILSYWFNTLSDHSGSDHPGGSLQRQTPGKFGFLKE